MVEDYEIVRPWADCVVESLRAFGYTLPNAIADLIDNSITAKATRINITMRWEGKDSWILIEDNGSGMTEHELVEAMRLGTISPLQPRALKDMGRFGLGLKTASFSQCRCLTVLTKKQGAQQCARCWDLDIIQKEREWVLIKGFKDLESVGRIGNLDNEGSGTKVLWQSLDRVVGDSKAEDERARKQFFKKVKEVSDHLGKTFHRYLEDKPPITIVLNEDPVEAWDPFLRENASTQPQPKEVFGSGNRLVTVEGYILPHQSKIGKDAFNRIAGAKGWSGQQGFYVYRNKRMIVDGSWLGFFNPAEDYKLARLQVDITNALDADWKLDVRKAQAHPPDAIAQELRRYAEATRRRASEVYRHRGAVLQRTAESPETVFAWQQVRRGESSTYRLNSEHPIVKQALNNPSTKSVKSLIRLAEETIPVNFILAAFSENAEKQDQPFEGNEEEILELAASLANDLRDVGMGEREIRIQLMTTEPFQHYPHIVERIVSS
jgi:hypothetical protein